MARIYPLEGLSPAPPSKIEMLVETLRRTALWLEDVPLKKDARYMAREHIGRLREAARQIEREMKA